MTDKAPTILPNRTLLTGTSGLAALASGLNAVKDAGLFSDAALADPLFKSPDTVRDYRLGHSEMGAVTFARGLAAYGEAFGGPLMALAGYRVVRLEAAPVCPVPVAGLLHSLVAALADGKITDRELAKMGPDIEHAGRVIDSLRARRAEMVR